MENKKELLSNIEKNEDLVSVCFSKDSVIQLAKKILELAEV